MANIHLSELLDKDRVSVLQSGFSKLTGVAVRIIDENGAAYTEPTTKARVCHEILRSTPEGQQRCVESDRMGARRAMRSGKTEVYTCPAGLCDFAAPIVVDGRFLGAVVGGQVLTEEPDDTRLRACALEWGLHPETLVEAMHEVPVKSREQIDRVADYLGLLADSISAMAASKYEVLTKARELENISRMKTEFLTTMNMNLHKPLQEMLFLANSINRMELPETAAEKLRKLEKMNQNVINTLADVMSYSELTRTDSDIMETQYDLGKLCEGLQLTYTGKLLARPVEFVIQVDEDVPTDLFGDVTRIRQILVNLLNNAVQYTQQGEIHLHISKQPTTYGLMLNFEIADTGIGMPPEQVRVIQEMFDRVHDSNTIEEDILAFGLGMTSQLVSAVYGSVTVTSTPDEGSSFVVAIPQMQSED